MRKFNKLISDKLNFNKLIIPTLFLAFNVCLVMYPADVLESARGGLLLWFNRVLPSLLPFAVGINALTGLGVIKKLGEYLSFLMEPLFNLPGAAGAALITGLTSGYPMGAKTAADLKAAKLLNDDEARRAAGFCNNAGPLFIVGLAGASLFGDAAVGYKLLAVHVASALILGAGLGFTSKRKRRAMKAGKLFHPKREIDKRRPATRGRGTPQPDAGVGAVLGESVKNAMETMTLIGGLIIFFSVVTRLLDVLGIVGGLAGGLLEVTNGMNALAAADGLDEKLRLALAAGFISFGGLSVHAQAAHFLAKENIRAGGYLLCKAIHGLLAFGMMTAVLSS